jgi:subtilase family serine protease
MGGLINHGNGNYSVSDYDDYNTIQNLPTNLTVLVPYGDPGGGNVEPTLDMQVAHGIAPGAQIVMVICSDLDLAQDYMVDNDLADVVSLSYGTYISSASSFTDYTVARGEQAAAEGISYFAGSGDWGSGQSAGSVDNPYTDPTLGASLYASHPYVTSVGGTSADWGANGLYWWGDNNLLGIFANAEFQTTTVSGHIPEDSWNGSGGGYSPIYAQPSWQTGVPGIPTGNGRTFPDVSLDAGGPGYFTCVSGGCTDGNSASLNFAP